MVDRLLVGLLTGGHVLLEGVPGLAKTLAVKSLADVAVAQVPPHPVHPRPAAGRPHRHADLQPARRLVHRQARAAVREPRARRRDQPRAAKVQSALLEAMQEQPGHARRRDPRARGAVPGAGDPESDRAGGHLPAARGAERPLHAEGASRLPGARRGEGDPAPRRAGAMLPTLEPQATRDEVLEAREALGVRLRRRQDPGVRARPRHAPRAGRSDFGLAARRA